MSAFGHDDPGRLIEAAYPDGRIRYFTYDARGLLTRETVVDFYFCAGLTATIMGTEDVDTIAGTIGDDVTFGSSGDDVIEAGRGDDIVCGGDGADTIFGEGGQDILVGGDRPDIIEGNQSQGLGWEEPWGTSRTYRRGHRSYGHTGSPPP